VHYVQDHANMYILLVELMNL